MGLRDAKMNFIVDVATSLFIKRSINDVTVRDIALEAGVGEATIYRYFSRKETIVLQCTMKLQNEVNQYYFNLDEGKTGLDKIAIFYNSFLEIFKDKPYYYNFIKDFDAFMISQSDTAPLSQYEKGLDEFKNSFFSAYQLGVQDGSITPMKNIDVFYFATTHSLLELCKKLSSNKALLTQDKTLKKSAEIQCLINIILKSLKNL